jgi:hypothetical protein
MLNFFYEYRFKLAFWQYKIIPNILKIQINFYQRDGLMIQIANNKKLSVLFHFLQEIGIVLDNI